MDNAIFDPLKQKYGFEQWRDLNTLGESLFIWRYYLAEDEFPGWKPVLIQPVRTPDWPPAFESVWQSADEKAEALLTVNVYEANSRLEAHGFVIRLLAEFQSSQVTRQEQGHVGDVAFAPPEDAAILFVRANLVILMQNGGREIIPLRPLASRLDESLITRPRLDEGQVFPQIRRFSVPAERVKTGDTLPLEIDAADPLGRPLWYKIFSPTGEIQLRDGSPIYIPSAAGEQRLTLFALNPNRAAVRQELTFSAE